MQGVGALTSLETRSPAYFPRASVPLSPSCPIGVARVVGRR